MVTTVLYMVKPQDKDYVNVIAQGEELECRLLFS